MADRTRAGTRLILRQQRRKATREGDSERAKAIGYALRSHRVFNGMLKEAEKDSSVSQIIDEDGNVVNVSQALGDGEFLKWFLDNFEKIMEIILKLIG